MNAKSPNSAPGRVDPDDAPELTQEWFDKATWKQGDKTLTKEQAHGAIARQRRGRPVGSVAAVVKTAVKLRIDPDVLAAYKATGAGWQTRMNAALRESVQRGRV